MMNLKEMSILEKNDRNNISLSILHPVDPYIYDLVLVS
jgi:predicted acetyltransferase